MLQKNEAYIILGCVVEIGFHFIEGLFFTLEDLKWKVDYHTKNSLSPTYQTRCIPAKIEYEYHKDGTIRIGERYVKSEKFFERDVYFFVEYEEVILD